MLTFGQGIVFVGKVAYALAKKLSWLLPDERSDQRDVLKSLAMTGSVDIARMTAQRNGQGEWFEQQLKEKPDLPDDVKKSYRDTRGFSATTMTPLTVRSINTWRRKATVRRSPGIQH